MARYSLWLVQIIAAVALTIHAVSAGSITFELPYGQRKCYSEDLPPLSTTRGTVHVSGGKGEMSLDLFVSDMRGVVQFHKSDVNSVKFSFRTGSYQVHTTEQYRFCIVNQVHPDAASTPDLIRRVTLVVDVVNKDREEAVGRLAKEDHVEKVQESFSSISTDVDDLIGKMDDLRAKEQMLTELNEQTSKVIFRISILACLFTVGTGVINFMSLKMFFKRKKLA